MTHRTRFWFAAVLLVGIAAGIVGERTQWFGLGKRRLSVEDCQGLSVKAPYDAWHFSMARDGSAVLVTGVGRNSYDVGFDPLTTVMGLQGSDQARCAFPVGTFDFSTICRELLRKRQSQTDKHHLDYADMPSRLSFAPSSQVWLDPAKRDQVRHDDLSGFLAPGEGQKLIEVAHDKAVALKLWPKELEDLWPYPPIPWGFEAVGTPPVPGMLRVKRPITLQQTWEGFLRDETLLKAAPEKADLGLGAAGVVNNEATWEKLWSVWRADEKAPKVDFEKGLVLVFTKRGWSKLGTPLMPLDAHGELTAVQHGTESQGGAGFAYIIGTLPREGIKSVNGVALVGK